MNTKTCYRFDEKTHEYRCTDLAFQEPIELTYPLPANCTFIEPPVVGDFEIAIFDGKSWEVKPDYRKHFEKGTYVGGKPYFNPNKYWWAEEQYMTEIGDIPEGMSFEKMEKPQIVSDVVELINEIRSSKQYLSDTDYIHNIIAEEPEKAEKYALVIEERKRVRATIDPTEEQIKTLKEQIVAEYGEEALKHLY